MRFILSNGEQMRESVQEFPVANELSCSKILVTCVANDLGVIAACGIRSMFNVLVLEVKEGYRGRGIGTETLKRAIIAAQKLDIGFITLSVSPDNKAALHLYSKFGFRWIVFLKKPDRAVMILPLALRGKLVYDFLKVCSVLPNIFLAQVHVWLYGKTTGND